MRCYLQRDPEPKSSPWPCEVAIFCAFSRHYYTKGHTHAFTNIHVHDETPDYFHGAVRRLFLFLQKVIVVCRAKLLLAKHAVVGSFEHPVFPCRPYPILRCSVRIVSSKHEGRQLLGVHSYSSRRRRKAPVAGISITSMKEIDYQELSDRWVIRGHNGSPDHLPPSTCSQHHARGIQLSMMPKVVRFVDDKNPPKEGPATGHRSESDPCSALGGVDMDHFVRMVLSTPRTFALNSIFPHCLRVDWHVYCTCSVECNSGSPCAILSMVLALLCRLFATHSLAQQLKTLAQSFLSTQCIVIRSNL